MYILERIIKQDWTFEYRALNTRGEVKASIIVEDSRYRKYTLVPTIKKISGTEEGIIILLNWLTTKLKGPIVSYTNRKILRDYGFETVEEGLVWETEEIIEMPIVVNGG